MTTPQEPDPTMPVPTGGEPTVPAGSAGEPTIPVQGEQFGGGGGAGGPTDEDFDEEGDNRRLWMIAGGILLLGLIIGIIIALLASGGDDDTDTTTTSSSTTSSTTSTSTTSTTTPPTTAALGPSISQFTVSDNSVSCPATTQVTLTWSTQNAQSVTVSIDNPNGPFGNYGPTDTEQFPFACGGGPGDVEHTYYLRANGVGGQTTQKQLTVTGSFPPPSSTTSTTT